MPWPFGWMSTVVVCAVAFVDEIEYDRRNV